MAVIGPLAAEAATVGGAGAIAGAAGATVAGAAVPAAAGAGAVAAAPAVALLSNPIGWGVLAILGVGAVVAVVATGGAAAVEIDESSSLPTFTLQEGILSQDILGRVGQGYDGF